MRHGSGQDQYLSQSELQLSPRGQLSRSCIKEKDGVIEWKESMIRKTWLSTRGWRPISPFPGPFASLYTVQAGEDEEKDGEWAKGKIKIKKVAGGLWHGGSWFNCDDKLTGAARRGESEEAAGDRTRPSNLPEELLLSAMLSVSREPDPRGTVRASISDTRAHTGRKKTHNYTQETDG